jgi:hypothetical protein
MKTEFERIVETQETIEQLKKRIKELENKELYNGWANYATWRINLECFDSINFVSDDVWGDDVSSFAEQLKGNVETRLDEEFTNEARNSSISNKYANAFISDVNWYEIAKNINESQKLGLSD